MYGNVRDVMVNVSGVIYRWRAWRVKQKGSAWWNKLITTTIKMLDESDDIA